MVSPPAPADAQIGLAKAYLVQGDWDQAAQTAGAALIEKRSVGETYKLIFIIISAWRQLGLLEHLRQDCRNFVEMMNAAFINSRSVSDRRASGDFWYMLIDIAIGCDDESQALDLFRQAQSPITKRADGVCFSRTASLQAWCESTSAECMFLEAPDTTVIASGNTSDPPSHYTFDRFAIGRVSDAEFFCGWDYVRTRDGIILADSGYTPLETSYDLVRHRYNPTLERVAHIWPTECQHIDEEALFLSTPTGFHVGHWIVDFLPRLRALQHLPETVKIAIPAQLPERNAQFIDLFGIDPARFIRCDIGRRYAFRSLIVAQVGNPNRPSPENVRFIAKATQLSLPHTRPRTRIFILRGIENRNVDNRAEFDDVLEKYGFESLNLATTSVEDQREKFALAELVIYIYGSDAFALYFMTLGSHIVELSWMKDDHSIERYCSVLGINYRRILCEETADTSSRIYKKDRNFIVDCKALSELIQNIIDKNF